MISYPRQEKVKPYKDELPNNERILSFAKSSKKVRLQEKVNISPEQKIAALQSDNIIGESDGMKRALKLAKIVANSYDTTALLEGETGTGKEVIAKVVHYHSARRMRPFIKINCGAISKDLVESELFGYGKGAFTGSLPKGQRGKCEIADGGTLFLDEISELELVAQVKLLRFLEDREFYPVGDTKIKKVDIRVVAATNTPLEQSVREGRFRKDLYYRLNVARIVLPPLRERKEDIIPLVHFFMRKFNKKFNKKFDHIAPEAEKIILNYPWDGNVREIKNTIERIILMEEGQSIKPHHFSFLCTDQPEKTKQNVKEITMPPDGVDLNEINKQLVLKALKKSHGNKAEAARLLNISRPTLVYRIRKYQIV